VGEGEEKETICHHGKWVSLGHAFFAEDDEGMTIRETDHKDRPVPVTIKCKPGPLVVDGSQHDHPVSFVERIFCINKKESPFLLGRVGLPKQSNSMDDPFDSSLEAGTKLVHPTCFFASSMATRSTHLVLSQFQHLPIPAGWTPGHLYSAMSCPSLSAWYTAQG
jgi:hypothetical protein